MDQEVSFAPMTEHDIPAVRQLHEACGLSYWSENSYQEAIKDNNSILYTAKAGNELAGFISVRLITSEFLCEILNIAVESKFRDKKIGSGLLLQLLNNIDSQISKIWLEVREGNRAAIGFYQGQGFKVVGNRKNFYRDPVENALLMQKDLG
jgi:ribosomal-protein-alanine N-acetyltransferase